MHTFSSVAVAAILASGAIAAPAPAPRAVDKASFTVPRVQNVNHVRDGRKALAKAYRKYGWPQIIWQPSGDGSDDPFSGFGGGWPFGSGSGSGSGSGFGSGAGASGVPAPSASFPAPFPASSFPAAAPTSFSSVAAPASSSAAAAPSASSNPNDASAPSSSASATTGQTGSVSATAEEGGAEYVCPVTIGGQTVNLDFDTGSADLWVYGTNAASQGQTAFNTAKSSTFQTISGASFEISYGDGSGASGTVGTDKVVVGGATVTKQAVEVATSVSAEFQQDVSDSGLLGLGFSNGNQVRPTPQKTFFANIQSSLAQPVFTVYLNESGQGEYEFGNIDSSKYSGDIHYTPVTSEQGYWQFTSTSYQIAGKTASNNNASPAIADTGTSLALVDDAVASAYYGAVSGAKNVQATQYSQGGWQFPCDADLPTFGVEIGSTGFYVQIPGSSINYQPNGDGTCYGGIQSNTQAAGVPLQIFGDVVLRNAFVVFDGGKTQLGWANKP